MCKFHKDVARALATDPATGQFDPAIYSIVLTATAKFRIEQYMPPLFGCDGYSRYEMATPVAAAAFKASSLRETNAEDSTQLLRQSLKKLAAQHSWTLSSLNLPADPVRDVSFLDEATVALYEGYTKPGYAAGALRLKDTAHKPVFEPLHHATAQLLRQPGVEPALRQLFENNVARLFRDAAAQANPRLLKLYNAMPGGLRRVFKSCAMCAGSGTAGFLVGHAGCLVAPAVIAVSGATAASSGIAVAAGAAATGVGLYAWYKLRGKFAKALEKKIVVGSAIAGLALSLSFHLGGGHEGHHDGHHDAHKTPAAQNDPMCGGPNPLVK